MRHALNTDLLRQIRDHVAEEPLRFIMGNYLSREDTVAPCGTAACYAGWAVLLGGTPKQQESVLNWGASAHEVARELLFGPESPDPDDEAGRLADALFEESNWPPEYLRASFDFPTSNTGSFSLTKTEDDDEVDVRAALQVESRRELAPRAVRLLDEVLARGEVWWVR